MAEECIFCRIAAGESPARVVYETERVVAFHDIRPLAPIHVLLIPREHVSSLAELEERHREVAAELLLAVPRVAEAVGGMEEGFRLAVNSGRGGGQTVFHLHLHLLGGKPFPEGTVAVV